MINTQNISESCMLCPRSCGANRLSHVAGVCGADDTIRIARAAPHFFEEPCISGTKGSGTVFFSGCNLGCIFCQNYDISHAFSGKEVTLVRLAEIIGELSAVCHNVSFVTGTHYTAHIAQALDTVKPSVPTVWNSSGYEKASSLRMLDGKIRVYLPDFKYIDSKLSSDFSGAADYAEYAKEAVAEMVKQRGKPVFDKDGIIKSGVIVRHLVLPGHTDDSKRVLSYLHGEYGNDIYLSIMRQYTPLVKTPYAELSRKLTTYEYDKVVDYALSIGIENAYIQEKDSADSSFIPVFDNTGV